MADYFAHWLELGERADPEKLPKVFYVNWFRKDEDGRFMWPGFGENSRVLEWIFRRCDGESEVEETAIGHVPAKGELNVDGLGIDDATVDALLHVDEAALHEELAQVAQHLARFGDQLPAAISQQFESLKARLRG
jgi:phosphoenolpyruvate carboxykinase (GTP)